jgi:hypothetical protein
MVGPCATEERLSLPRKPVDKVCRWEESPRKRRGPRGVAVSAQGKVHLMMIRRIAAVFGLAACPILVGSSASASPPDHEVTNFKVYGEDTFTCSVGDNDFEVLIAGTYSQRFTFFYDANGNLTRFNEYVSAPHDVLTNTTTGESIVVRGHFVQVATRVGDTNVFDRTITGFRYMIDEERGAGVTIQEVGRIVYDNLEETSWHDLAGQHDLADPLLVEPTICAALA